MIERAVVEVAFNHSIFETYFQYGISSIFSLLIPEFASSNLNQIYPIILSIITNRAF